MPLVSRYLRTYYKPILPILSHLLFLMGPIAQTLSSEASADLTYSPILARTKLVLLPSRGYGGWTITSATLTISCVDL